MPQYILDKAKKHERESFAQLDKLSWKERVWLKAKYAGIKYNILPSYDGCYVDEKGEPVEEIGMFGILAMNVALPYYLLKETAVILKRKL